MSAVNVVWGDFKSIANLKQISMQFLDVHSEMYEIFIFDGPLKIRTVIPKDGGADCLDFENNFKLNTNKRIDATKDSEGANLSLLKLAPAGWTYQMYCYEVETSVSGTGVYHHNTNGVIDNSFLVYKMYSSVSGYGDIDLTADPTVAVKTVVDFEPTHDMRIIKGQLFQKTVPSEDVYFNLIGVPDLPYAYGGSRVLVEGLDLTFLTNGRPIESDGKVPKHLQYSAVYHSNKLRTTLYHNAGFKHKIMMAFEFYKP